MPNLNRTAGRAQVAVALVLIVAAGLFVAACSSEADKSLESAGQVAQAGHDALKNQDWQAYAELLHPDEADRFKQLILPELIRFATRDSSDTVTLFDRTMNVDTLRAMPPDTFFIDMLSNIFRISPELKRSFGNMRNLNVGAVAESDTIAHVVVHTTMKLGMEFVDEMNVTSLRKYEGVWRLRLSGKLEGIALMLRQSLQMQTG